jgi:hypothetical protein
MYPPADVCRRLAAYHKQLRLGWHGEIGKFALIQLYTRRDAKKTFKDIWNFGPYYHGPAFSKTGRPMPDWDSWSRLPVYVSDVEPEDVYSGYVLQLVRRWSRPIASRVKEKSDAKADSHVDRWKNLGKQVGANIYRDLMRKGHDTVNVAKKHQAISQREVDYRDGLLEQDMRETVSAVPPSDGWEAHTKKDQGDPGDLGSVGGNSK